MNKIKKYTSISLLLIGLIVGVIILISYMKYKTKLDFFQAVSSGDIDKVQMLLNNGFEVSTKYNGATALNFAAFYEQPEMVKFLLGKGVNPNIRAKNGNTPLTDAIVKGNYEIVDLLLNNGVPPSQLISGGMPALHFAVQEGNLKIIQLLIDKGANVNRVYFQHISPLSTAVSGGNAEIVKLLLKNGARPDGKSMKFAQLGKKTEIIALLEKYKNKEDSKFCRGTASSKRQ